MLRLTLAVTLMLTQTWQAFAAPVYFCVAPDGSLGVDLGPESCGCRNVAEVAEVETPSQVDQSASGPCASRGCCDGHDREDVDLVLELDQLPVDATALAPVDCLCKHVPVSCTSAQVVSKSRNVLRAPSFSNVGCLRVQCESLVSGSADWGLRPSLDDSGGRLRSLKCIVLRC